MTWFLRTASPLSLVETRLQLSVLNPLALPEGRERCPQTELTTRVFGALQKAMLEPASHPGCIHRTGQAGEGPNHPRPGEEPGPQGRPLGGPPPTADGSFRHPGWAGLCLVLWAPPRSSWDGEGGGPSRRDCLRIRQPSFGPFQRGIPNANNPAIWGVPCFHFSLIPSAGLLNSPCSKLEVPFCPSIWSLISG